MAQSRDKRNRRSKRKPATTGGPSAAASRRTTRLQRIVIAFLIVVGLAGILAISASLDDGTGHPTGPRTAHEPAR